jgi:hypothetical protein
MEVLMSNWTDVQSLPASYVLPPDERPGKHVFPVCKDIPIVDLEKARCNERTELVQQILKATQDFGFFRVQASSVYMLDSIQLVSSMKLVFFTEV